MCSDWNPLCYLPLRRRHPASKQGGHHAGTRKDDRPHADSDHRRRGVHRIAPRRRAARARLRGPRARQPRAAGHGPDARRPAYLDRRGRAGTSATCATRRRCAARSTASTRCSTSPRRSASARACTRSRSTPSSTTSAPPCCSRRLIEQPGRAAGRRVEHERLRRRAVPRRRTAGACSGAERTLEQLRRGRMGAARRRAATALAPVPTPETKAPSLASVYALSKYDQERLCLMIGRAYGIPTVALRFFNVYGTAPGALEPVHRRAGDLRLAAAQRQSAADLRGRHCSGATSSASTTSRRACRLALEAPAAAGQVFNIGSGQSVHRPRGRRADGARCSGKSTSSPRSPASTGSATSATASPTSRWRGSVLGLRAAGRRSSRGWWSWPAGWRTGGRWTASTQARAELAARGLTV